MHWTAFLAYNRWPREARVIDDVPCISCGQNLRSIQVWGRCPKCGIEARDSLHVLAKPAIVAGTIAAIGKSYVVLCALLLGCVAPWGQVVATAIIAIASTWRAGAVAVLRYRGAINRLHVIGDRLSFLWWCAIIDAAVSVAWVATVAALAYVPALRSPSAAQILTLLGIAWTIVTFSSAAFAGWFGLSLATMLGYGWLRVVLKIQLFGIAAAILAIALAGLLILASPAYWLIISGVALAAVVCMAAIVLTAVSLIQLSNAAYQADELWEEAVAA